MSIYSEIRAYIKDANRDVTLQELYSNFDYERSVIRGAAWRCCNHHVTRVGRGVYRYGHHEDCGHFYQHVVRAIEELGESSVEMLMEKLSKERDLIHSAIRHARNKGHKINTSYYGGGAFIYSIDR